MKTDFTVTEEEKLNYVGCDYIVTSKGITMATTGYTEGGIKEGDERVTDEERRLNFEIDTEGAKLKMVTSLLWKLKGVMDTGFSTDVDTRRSITGYLTYFSEALIPRNNRLQRNVTFSSTEGEYVGLSEINTKILCVRDIFVFMGIQIEYPIFVHVDNTGEFF